MSDNKKDSSLIIQNIAFFFSYCGFIFGAVLLFGVLGSLSIDTYLIGKANPIDIVIFMASPFMIVILFMKFSTIRWIKEDSFNGVLDKNCKMYEAELSIWKDEK